MFIVLSAVVLAVVLAFVFIFRSWKKKLDDMYDFISKLISKYPNPKIHSRWSLNYLWNITLKFQEEKIIINLQYDYIREEWELEIWSWEAKSFLFYYDCLDPTPHDSINLLLNKFNLRELTDKAVEEKERKAEQKEAKLKEVINRITGTSSSPLSKEKD